MAIPDHVVFDTEPIVAHAADELGSEIVQEYLDAIDAGDTDGYINRVNLTEIRYILTRKYDRIVADDYLDWLIEFGLIPVDTDKVWTEAAKYVIEYNPALGDSFALATADHLGATLLVGADGDYDAITEGAIERFRDEPV